MVGNTKFSGRQWSRVVLAALVVLVAVTGHRTAAAEAVPLLRISTENTTTHVHTRVVARFIDELHRRSAGRLDVRLHHGAELFRDRDVVSALNQGKAEMAVPGTWQLERYEPDVAVFALPIFFGRTKVEIDRVRDGEVGSTINRRVERALGVKVLGRWIDLGFANLYGVKKPVRRHEDLAGRRVRVAGGEANSMRIEALGAEAVVIPWPDLVSAVETGTVDALLSTHETVASAELWSKGIRDAFEDHEYFPQYVPLMAGDFWERLGPELRTTVIDAWEAVVDWARAEAENAQAEARTRLVNHGVVIVKPTTSDLLRWRRKCMVRQEDIVNQLGIDRGLVARVAAALEGGE